MAKLLYFISEDWFFRSHFLGRAQAALRAGHDVVVLTRQGASADGLRQAGFRLLPLQMERSSTKVWRELGVLRQVWRAYRHERPDLIHQVALKPILYGSLVARSLGLRAVVNAPVGMGYLFTGEGARGRLLRASVRMAMRFLLNPAGSRVVFENEEDLMASTRARTVRAADAVLIRGAGVDLMQFAPALAPPAGVPVVVLGARMLRDKGVLEFVQAARLLRAQGAALRCVLVGAPDPGNPSSLRLEQLQQWQREGVVEYWGHREDMAHVLQQCHMACLPSYREGLPKFLLEAMACGLPVVSTDVAGCREAVVPGHTGVLVPPRQAEALADALQGLVCDAALRRRMGEAGRARALALYGHAHIVQQTMDLYASLLEA